MKGQTTENMQTMTRSALRKTLNTVLDQVALYVDKNLTECVTHYIESAPNDE